MSAPTSAVPKEVETANELAPDQREALRLLLLVLADSKRLLGIRYSDWMLGAPMIEAGIAASSMAQDEWGHGRLTYALLSDFGDDPKAIEHEREASEYSSIEVLDRPLRSWAELIAASLVVDTALTIQYGALVGSRYSPVHNRVLKLLDEEAFHFQYAAGWSRRLASANATRDDYSDCVTRLIPVALRWFGREESPGCRALLDAAIVREGPDALRARYLARLAPVLERDGLVGAAGITNGGAVWRYERELDWSGWDDATRRAATGGPDADTLARVRGDKNRSLLLD